MYKKHFQRAQRIKNDSVLEIFDAEWKKILWAARLKDYSSTGAAFISSKELKEGDIVNALLRIFSKGCFRITGKVVRKTKLNEGWLYALKYDSFTEVFPTGEKKNFD